MDSVRVAHGVSAPWAMPPAVQAARGRFLVVGEGPLLTSLGRRDENSPPFLSERVRGVPRRRSAPEDAHDVDRAARMRSLPGTRGWRRGSGKTGGEGFRGSG